MKQNSIQQYEHIDVARGMTLKDCVLFKHSVSCCTDCVVNGWAVLRGGQLDCSFCGLHIQGC